MGSQGDLLRKHIYRLRLEGTPRKVCCAFFNDVYSLCTNFASSMERIESSGRNRLSKKANEIVLWLEEVEKFHEYMPDTVGAGKDVAAAAADFEPHDLSLLPFGPPKAVVKKMTKAAAKELAKAAAARELACIAKHAGVDCDGHDVDSDEDVAPPPMVAAPPMRHTGVQLPYPTRFEVYAHYVKDLAFESPEQRPPTFGYFSKIWRRRKPHMVLRKHLRFSKCDACIFWRNRIGTYKRRDEKNRENSRKQFHKHLLDVRTEREYYHNKRRAAAKVGSDTLSMIFDGADQGAYGQRHACRGQTLGIVCC